MRRSWLAIMCTMTVLGAGGALASSASAAATLSVLGTVNTPATYTPAQLAALPQTTLTISGVTYTGVLVETIVTNASPVFPIPAPNNPALRVTATVTSDTPGANGGPVTFALGELAANFGFNRGLIALTEDGNPPAGGPKLVLPRDTSTARFVTSVAQINVVVRNVLPSSPPPPAGGINVRYGATITTLTAAQLAALPQATMAVSYMAGAATQNRTENGPLLSDVLTAAGIVPTANTYIASVAGTDGYIAVVTPAEAGIGARPLMISIAETVTETGATTTATPRLVPNGDLRGGRYNSNVSDLVVGEGTVVALPTLTATNPVSPSNSNNPSVTGTAPAGSTVRLYTNAACTSVVAATGTAAAFASPGLTVTAPGDATTTFYATATDAAGTASSGCSTSSIAYVEDSTPPAAPTLTATDPVATANNNSPKVKGTAAAGLTVKIYTDATCTAGALVATGTAADFASPGLTVAVANNTSTTFRATATDTAGNASTCSTTSVPYVEDSSAPPAPTLTATDPASPAINNAPRIQGAGESGATIRLYTDAACTGTVAATGSAALLAGFGVAVTVADNSTTTFYATATDQAGNVSGCSTSSIAYVENSIAPVVQPTPVVSTLPIVPAPMVDRTPPAATLGGSTSRTLGTRVSVTVACTSEPCRATVSGSVRVPKVRAVNTKTFKLAAVVRTLSTGATSRFTLKLSRAARSAIRRALRAGRPITVGLTITVADAADNTKTLTRKVKLKL